MPHPDDNSPIWNTYAPEGTDSGSKLPEYVVKHAFNDHSL